MPTVLRIRGYRFFFYANEGDEPPHVHVERDNDKAKLWLSPVRLERSRGFARHEINSIQKMVEENQKLLLRGWNECFTD
jgi:hypothetical protein